jgi:VWFA-related protein
VKIAAFLAVALVLPTLAQQLPLSETIEVRVANIDVVVRDKAGNPVTGLTKDDFVLYDDKAVQTITNFYEVRRGLEPGSGGPAAAAEAEVPVEVRQRRVVIFVDAGALGPANKSGLLNSVRRFVETSLRPEDRVMLVAWRLGLHVVTPFTASKEAIHHGLDEISKLGQLGDAGPSAVSDLRKRIDDLFRMADSESGASLPLVSYQEAFDESRTMVERYAVSLEGQERQMIDAMQQVATSMAGLEGKKVLLYAGENFPDHPGADMNRYVNNLFAPHLDRNNMPELDTVLGFTGNTLPNVIDQLGKDVSANGVAIYAIGAASTDSDASAENNTFTDQGYTFTRDAATARTLEQLANLTGGVAVTRTSNFDLAFDTINKDLGSYYSIGYRPTGEGAHQHKIVVKTKNTAYNVRARQSFVTKSTDDQMEDRAIANLYTQPARNDWPIEVKVGQPQPDEGKYKVPVQVIMPATVTMLPDRDKITGSFTLYFVVGTNDGGMSPVLRRPQTFSFPKEAEQQVRAQPMTFSTQVRVNKGESILSVAIIDQLSGAMGFVRTQIVAK